MVRKHQTTGGSVNWYNGEKQLYERTREVSRALFSLKFTAPDFNPEKATFEQLLETLVKNKLVPEGVNVERFAGMVMFLIKNKNYNEVITERD